MAVLKFEVKDGNIDVGQLKRNINKLNAGLIKPAKEQVSDDIVEEHAAEPIKSVDDIFAISRYLIQSRRFRDNMLVIVGINFGLRVSDLRMLRFCNLINENLTYKDRFPVFEKKTRNTRKRKKNRYITVNTAVKEAVTLYLENVPSVSLSDFMFRSESNRGGNTNKPLSPQSIDRILKGIASELSLSIKMSTHTLRKTFCYHQMLMSRNDPRKLLLLQKMLGHSSPAQTLDYIGITAEEIDEAYNNLNLGSEQHNYLVEAEIQEQDITAG